MEKRKVVIAGAGISGLATAYYLKKAGFEDFVLLERNLEPGGLCRSIKKDGFTFDFTGHFLWQMDAPTQEFYNDLLGANRVWIDRKSAVYFENTGELEDGEFARKFVPYPFQTHLGWLPRKEAYECVKGFLATQNTGYPGPRTFEQWSLSNFGSGIHEHFMKPFNEKLFGVPLHEMTDGWCKDIPVPTVDQILRGALLKEEFVQKGNSKFMYPREGGMQSLVDALVEYIGEDKILTGRSIVCVDTDKKKLAHRDMRGNINEFEYGHLVSAMPLRSLLRKTVGSNKALEEGRNSAGELRSTNVVCFMLGFKHPIPTNLHWLYLPSKKHLPYRIGVTSNITDGLAPEGCGAITAEVTLPKNITSSWQTMVDKISEDLNDIGWGNNKIITWHAEPIVPAYVIYDKAQQKAQSLLREYHSAGIYSIGRYGMWRYSSVSKDVEVARGAAKDILEKTC